MRGLVGIQFITNTHGASVFHTFCLVLHNGKWYIGDNMLGFLLETLPESITTDYIQKCFIVVTDKRLDKDNFTRTYSWVQKDGTLAVTIANVTRPQAEHIGVHEETYFESRTDIPDRNYFYHDSDACVVLATDSRGPGKRGGIKGGGRRTRRLQRRRQKLTIH